jgi:DDE family transposase
MTPDSLLNEDWCHLIERLGGAASLRRTARESGAFRRARGLRNALDLLRLVLAYCLGHRGLRSTAAWAAACGLADLSNPALLGRLRRCGDWLGLLVGQALAAGAPPPCQGRLIRIIDATTVSKAGSKARRGNQLWRIHSAFDLPAERFGCFILTDQAEGERLDRIAVVPGEIRIADRVHLQPRAIAAVREAGGDIVVRAGWRNARWRDGAGQPLCVHALLSQAGLSQAGERLDQPIWIDRGRREPALALRLVALRKSDQAAAEARRKARAQARKSGYTPSRKTLDCAGWLILVTSLPAETFSTEDILALYRLRWRVELGFKRLKSLIGLRAPPGKDPRSARPWLLAHLLMILLLEPLVDALEDSPPVASAA